MAHRTQNIIDLEALENQFRLVCEDTARPDMRKLSDLQRVLDGMGEILQAAFDNRDYDLPELAEYVGEFLTRDDLSVCFVNQAFSSASAPDFSHRLSTKMMELAKKLQHHQRLEERYTLPKCDR
jgi:hypothetical protein